MSKLPKQVVEYLSTLGKKGGAAKSDAKAKAARENARKARMNRWIKRTKKVEDK